MSIKHIIYFYSKYSNQCKQIEKDIYNIQDLIPLCIDSEKIRRIILSDNKFHISKVPCILLIHENGNFEKFEGNNAVNWISDIISKHEKEKQDEKIANEKPVQTHPSHMPMQNSHQPPQQPAPKLDQGISTQQTQHNLTQQLQQQRQAQNSEFTKEQQLRNQQQMIQNQKNDSSSLLDLDNKAGNTTQIGDLLSQDENNFLQKYKMEQPPAVQSGSQSGGSSDDMMEIAKKMQQARN